MAIITISRQFGSFGTEIAKALKEELGLDDLDKIKLEEILVSEYGLPEKNVEKYDEKKPPFWDLFSSDKDRYLHFMKTALYAFAKSGNSIIVGRGGQVLLKNVPGVLHVRIIAPLEVRIDRVKTRYSYSDKLAEQIIRRSDHDRIGFHKFFFHANWGDPDLYDLTLNTRSLSIAKAVELIKATLDTSPEQQAILAQKMSDLCLSQEIITHIAYDEKIPVQFLEAHVENGVVTLKGSTITSEEIDHCEQLTRKLPGVKDVINEIYFIPNTYGVT